MLFVLCWCNSWCWAPAKTTVCSRVQNEEESLNNATLTSLSWCKCWGWWHDSTLTQSKAVPAPNNCSFCLIHHQTSCCAPCAHCCGPQPQSRLCAKTLQPPLHRSGCSAGLLSSKTLHCKNRNTVKGGGRRCWMLNVEKNWGEVVKKWTPSEKKIVRCKKWIKGNST